MYKAVYTQPVRLANQIFKTKLKPAAILWKFCGGLFAVMKQQNSKILAFTGCEPFVSKEIERLQGFCFASPQSCVAYQVEHCHLVLVVKGLCHL